MNFKRNDVQEFIESELRCFDIEPWSSFKGKVENWSIDNSNIDRVRLCVQADINSYFFKAFQSFAQALHEISRKKYAWSIVKLYYTTFYLLRCEILLSGNIIIRCKSMYYVKIAVGEKPVRFNPNKYKGDHQLTIALEEKLYKSYELQDPILDNKLDGENPYMWIMGNRDRVNYQMKDFSDPVCDPILNKAFAYFQDNDILSLLRFYNDNDYSICFDMDHAILAIPYKKLLSIYRSVSTAITMNAYRDKLIETNKLLFDIGIKKRDFINLLR
jgi:hypothetical protein